MQKRNSFLINKAFNKYLWASVMTVAATQVSGIVDATLVGNFVSAEGLAAVNINKPLIQALYSITILYLAGGTMLTGMAIGNGDRPKANRIFTADILTSLILGIIATALGLCYFDDIVNLLCGSVSLRPLVKDFTFVTILSFIPMALMFAFQQYVTIDGSPRMVTLSVIVGNAVNLTLDIVFMKFFGWGMAGAAWATLISYIVCCLMVLPHFMKAHTLRLARFSIRASHIGKLLGIGIPLFLSTCLLSVQYWGNNRTAETFLGDNGLMTLAVCMQLFSFSMIILTGCLRTIQPVGAILKGMNDTTGIKMLMKRAYGFMGICLLVYALAIVLIPEEIGGLLGVTDPEGMNMVKQALPAFSLHIIMQAMLYNLLPAYQFYDRKNLALFLSIGQTLLPMILFWLTEGSWMGFFYGQMITAMAILAWCAILKQKDRSLSAFFLIPTHTDIPSFATTIEPSIKSLSHHVTALRKFLSKQNISERTCFAVALCTEELVKNIYEHGHAHAVDLGVKLREEAVEISIHDDGAAFNPVEYIKDSEEKLGIGLTMAHAYSQDINYNYIFNQNMLTIRMPR